MLAAISRTVRRLRHARTSRAPGQGLVEFGIGATAIALFSIVGFHTLGMAQQAYWGGPVQTALAQPTPTTSDFVHPTVASLACDRSKMLAAASTTCTVALSDTYTSSTEQEPPKGTARLADDNASWNGTCSLIPSSSNLSRCAISWTPQPGDVGTRTLTLTYAPTTNHQQPAPTPSVQITVQPVVKLGSPGNPSAPVCTNPYYTTGSNPYSVEPGHPLICTVYVYDSSGTTLFSQPTDVTWLPQPTSLVQPMLGNTILYCSNTSSCSGPNPAVNGPLTCHADPHTGEKCTIIFRRSYDDNSQITSSTQWLSATAQATDNPNENTSTIQLSLLQPQGSHPTQSELSCSGPGVIQITHNVMPYGAGNTVQLMSAKTLAMPGDGTVNCTLVVLDLDPNPTMAQFGCAWGSPLYCQPDNGDAHPPLGVVSFVDQNQAPFPNQSGTCQSNGLGHQGARPTGVFAGSGLPSSFGPPAPLTGAPDYVSWCNVTLTVPVGTTQLAVTYNGESVPGTFKPHMPITYAQADKVGIALH